MTDKDEAKDAGELINKVIESRDAKDAVNAVEAVVDMIGKGVDAGYGWKEWTGLVVTVLLALAGAWTGTSVVISEVKSSIKSVKDDMPPVVPVPVPTPVADATAKLLAAWITESRESSKLLTKQLASIDAKLSAPIVPIDPDAEPIKPKPAQKLILPKQVTVVAGSSNAVKIKASGAVDVQWTWEPSQGLEVDKHGATAYVSAEKDGLYWVFAYTVKNGVVNQIAACMVVAGEGPRPPPGPNPPGPSDPFRAKIQAAFEADGRPAAWAVKLANIYRDSASVVNDPACKKASSVILVMHKRIEAELPSMLIKIRTAIADELDATLGVTDFTLDATSRSRIAAQYARILAALEALK